MNMSKRIGTLERLMPSGGSGITATQWAALPDEDLRFLAGLPDHPVKLGKLDDDTKQRADEICRRLAGNAAP